MKKILYSVLIIFLLHSCTDIIEIDLPRQDSKLVINSLFCPDSVFKINVSKSTKFIDEDHIFVDNAVCKLYANDQYLFDLMNIGDGFYIAPDNYKPTAGIRYKIEVSHIYLPSVTAEDSIPNYTPKILNIKIIDSAEVNEDNHYINMLNFDFEDQVNVANFYEFRVFKKEIPYIYTYSKMFITMVSDDLILVNESLLDYFVNNIPFNDLSFTNQTHNFSLKFNLPIQNKSKSSKYHAVDYTLILYTNTGSEAYYNYQKKLIQHINNQNPDFWSGMGTPVVMYSNINNGYGIFAGYNQRIDSIFVDNVN